MENQITNTPQPDQEVMDPHEDQVTVNQPVQTEVSPTEQVQQQPKKKVRNIIIGAVAVVLVLAIGYLGYTVGPNLFKAEITEVTTYTPPVGTQIYIPSYNAVPGDTGNIAVKSNIAFTETFDSIVFTLTFNPVNALIFDSTPFVFTPDDTVSPTLFESASLSLASYNPTAGTLDVILNADQEVQPSMGEIIFKLNAQINPDLAMGQVITMDIEDFGVFRSEPTGLVQLDDVVNMEAGTITLGGGNELKVLNAEATDSTHIKLQFSGYLQEKGNSNYYRVFENNGGIFGDELSVMNVVLNSDQKSVNLTTVAQDPGQEYVVVVTGDVIEGPDGSLNDNYRTALFHGYGQPTAALSDFNMVSAVVIADSYNQIEVTFSDNVKADSVSVSDFDFDDASVVGAVASGNKITLTVDEALLKKNVYVLTVSGDILDEADNPLGVNKVAFTGSKNGPKILSASVTPDGDTYKVQINFNENIEYPDPEIAGNPIGGLYINRSDTGATSTLPSNYYFINEDITDFLTDFAYNVSGSTITLTHNIFGDPGAYFAFWVSDSEYLVNSVYGAPIDPSFNTISFGGSGYTSPYNPGNLNVINKNTIELLPGNLNFDDIDDSNIVVMYNDDSSTQDITSSIESVSRVGISASDCPDCKLVVTFNENLKPNRNYTFSIVDGGPDGDIIAVKRFFINQDLSLVSAEATADNQVTLEFSQNLDSDTVDLDDFFISSSVTVNGFAVQSDYKHVILTVSPMDANTVYTVNAANDSDDPIYAYQGGNMLGKSGAAFGGYGTTAVQSSVKVSGIQNLSSTQVQLNFTAPVDPATVTPINVKIKKVQATICPETSVGDGDVCDLDIVDDGVNYKDGDNYCECVSDTWDCSLTESICNVLSISPLGISGDITGSGNSYTVTTSKQTAGTNYFVVMDGVEDTDGQLIGNTKIHNFFGFELPAPIITSVIPASVTNDLEQTVTITGQNLNIVQTAKIGNQTVTFVSSSATSMTITVPAGITPGSYSITLIDNESKSKVFSNAILILSPETPMQVISEQSKSIPLNVPNDGTTAVTLWVLVYDPVGLSDISSVIVDLSQIGGPSTQSMIKNTGTQPQYSQWYTYNVTVPPTVSTAIEPYLLPVEVHKGSDIVTGTVSIKVTGDVYQSVAPTIDQIYVNPISVPPDGQTPIKISAQVSDIDGADSISSVIADLGSIGAGFVSLTPLDTGDASELVTRFYESEEFTVPNTTPTGQYTINVTASDDTGENASKPLNLTVSTALTGPSIDSAKSYVTRKSIPNDGKTSFSLYAYVKDPDGVGDIASVTASFGAIGLPPAVLLKDPDTADNAKSAYFVAEGLTIPKTAPFGIHSIEITAEDSTGGLANKIIQIDVTYKDTLGEPPIVIQDKGYTTPKVAINDGETPITLYAFVRDDDNDLESVVVNLSQIGQVGPETGGDFAQSDGGGASAGVSGGTCPTGSNVMVCMNPSFKEGDQGQWFILSGVTISKSTVPSSEPYMVDIIAADVTGKTSYGNLPVYVNDGESFTNDRLPPEVMVAVPTSPTTVEVLFSEEITATSVSAKEFTITDKDDVTKKLNVTGATINAIGTIVTLTTDNQTEGKQYVLSASSGIRDALGIPLVAGAANRVFFNGFKASGKVPAIDYITAMDVDLVEIEFRDNLKPSTLKLAPVTREQAPVSPGDFNIEIFEAETGEILPVRGVAFGEQANVLVVLTAPQKNNERYRVQVKDIASYDGKKSDVGTSKTFKGYNLRAVQRQAAANMADLDGDGRVDFSDFTIFSSLYGTVYYEMTQGGTASAETGGQPIPPEPDALVPVTSEPTGGDVPIQ